MRSYRMRDVGVNIRVTSDERARFTQTCRDQGERPSTVMRRFMRTYVELHRQPVEHWYGHGD